MLKVPNSFGGASRRAYQGGYQKGSSSKVSDLLGKRKLSTPQYKKPKAPADLEVPSNRNYAKGLAASPEVPRLFSPMSPIDTLFDPPKVR